MDTGSIIEIAGAFAEAAKSVIPAKSVYLFGSQAWGKADAFSDIDVAVVVEECTGSLWNAGAALFQIAYTIDPRIEPILLEEAHDSSGFLAHIQKNGIKIA